MSETTANGTDGVVNVLNAIGWRAAVARYLPVLVFILALGVIAMSLAVLLAGEARSGLLPPIGAVTLAAIVVTVLLALRPPSRSVVARRVDFSLRLSERLSSAIGVSSGAKSTPVLRALQNGARHAAAEIEVARAIPLYTRLLGLALAALFVALCGAAVAIGVTQGASVQSPIAAQDVAAPDLPLISADELDVLAQLIADDAERRNSEYLEALANSVEQLAEAARRGAPQRELEAQLEALLEHASGGYEGQLPNWMSDNAGDASGVLQSAMAYNTARQQAAEQREKLGGEGPRISSADMYKLDDDRLNAGAIPTTPANRQQMDGAIADREGELQSGSPSGGSDFAATPMEDEAFQSAGSLPVGAAAQSGKGESNIAGGGSQALAESSAYLETMADPTEAMSIASAETGDGSRIRLHVSTDAELTEVTEIGGQAGADWDRQVAQSVSRQVITPSDSAAVARYFNRTISGQDQ